MVVHRGEHNPGHYVWSPFVTKLEFRLRLANLSYECGDSGPLSGPRGKIPYIDMTAPGKPSEVLSDSTLISRNFIERRFIRDLNVGLSKKEVAQSVAIKALLEDRLVYCNAHERWIKNYYTMRNYTMAKMPLPIRTIIGYLAYRGTVRKLYDQGMGRFTEDEIHSFRIEIWESINDILEDSRRKAGPKECFWAMGGTESTEVDTTIFGFVVSCQVARAGPVSRELVRSNFPTVVDYATRIHHHYFPDYKIWD